MGGLATGAGNKRAPNAERGLDLYETPSVAVDALVHVERQKIPIMIWEPACGPGAMVRALKRHGYVVRGSDIADYGSPDQHQAGLDFLDINVGVDQQYLDWPAIITNPPFLHARQFVELATERAPYVAMLLRLAFLESMSRMPLFQRGDLARVHVFSRRLPMMHRDGWEGRKANSAMAFAWFVWERAHSGPPTLHWLDWAAITQTSEEAA